MRISATFCSISLSSEPRGSRSLDEDIAAFHQQRQTQLRAFRSPKQLAALHQQHQQQLRTQRKRRRQRSTCCSAPVRWCTRLQRIPLFLVLAAVLFVTGVAGLGVTIERIARATVDTDYVLFLGALVSCAFSLVVVLCYVRSATVRRLHPNALIFSKRCVIGPAP